MSAGKLGEVWQRVGQLQTVCLAKAASSQTTSKPGALSRAALRESLKWAAAHTPRQPSVRVMTQRLPVSVYSTWLLVQLKPSAEYPACSIQQTFTWCHSTSESVLERSSQ